MRADGYGHRAKIGLVYIASSVVMEPECCALAPDGVSIHTSRVHLDDVSLEGVSQLGGSHLNDLVGATRLLAEAPLDSIVFACTSGSFAGGHEYDRQIMGAMSAVARGIPVTTTTTACVNALRAIHAEKIALLTPYVDAVGERARVYFSEAGFDIVAERHLGLDQDWAIGEVSPQEVYEEACLLDLPQVDSIFIGCTNLRTIAILDALERHVGKPVVTAIQASFWEALRLAGVGEAISDCGRLMTL